MLQIWLIHPDIMIGPVVEKVGNNSFINMQPYDLIRKGKVQDIPLIACGVADEGLWTAARNFYFFLHCKITKT